MKRNNLNIIYIKMNLKKIEIVIIVFLAIMLISKLTKSCIQENFTNRYLKFGNKHYADANPNMNINCLDLNAPSLFDTATNNCNSDSECGGFIVHRPSKKLCFFEKDQNPVNWDDQNEQNIRLSNDNNRDIYSRM